MSPPSFVVPSAQAAQEVSPTVDVYVPAAHGAQLAVRPAATVVPKAPAAHVLHVVAPARVVLSVGGQAVQEGVPAALTVPTAQGEHAALDDAPDVDDVPAGQGVGDCEESGQ